MQCKQLDLFDILGRIFAVTDGRGGCFSTQQNPDDVVITLALRTPIAKGFKGGLKDTELDIMIHALMKEVLEKSKIDPNLIEDVVMGNVRQNSRLVTVKESYSHV